MIITFSVHGMVFCIMNLIVLMSITQLVHGHVEFPASNYDNAVLIKYTFNGTDTDICSKSKKYHKSLYLTAPNVADSEQILKLCKLSTEYMPKGSIYLSDNVPIAWGSGDYQLWKIVSSVNGTRVSNMANPSFSLDLIQISSTLYQIPVKGRTGKFITVDNVMNNRLIELESEPWEPQQQWQLASFPPEEYLKQCYYIENNQHPDLYITVSNGSFVLNPSKEPVKALGGGRALVMQSMKRDSNPHRSHQLWFPEFDPQRQWTVLHSASAPDCVLDVALEHGEYSYLWPAQGSNAWHQQWNIDHALNNCSWGPIFCNYGSDPLYLYTKGMEEQPLERYSLSIIAPLNSSAKWRFVRYFDHDETLIVVPSDIMDPYSYDNYFPDKVLPKP